MPISCTIEFRFVFLHIRTLAFGGSASACISNLNIQNTTVQCETSAYTSKCAANNRSIASRRHENQNYIGISSVEYIALL